MQSATRLGMSLGQMLAGALDNSAYQKGAFDAEKHKSDMMYRKALTEKAMLEADKARQEMSLSSDDGLASTLLAGIGANSEDGMRDFKATMAGNYQPPTKPLAFVDGGTPMPPPEYVNKFPELQQRYAALKQMLALGDKNFANLSKGMQGDQRNALTKDLATMTPQEAATTGLKVSALEGNVNPLEMQKTALLYGLTNGDNSIDAQNAMLLANGKTRYDNMGGQGTFDLLTGLSKLNELGLSGVSENKAQAAQAYAGANENNAQANLAGVRATNIKEGKGDGTGAFKVDSSYQQALGSPATDSKGNPMVDPFSGRQIMNRNTQEEENFLKWASDNKYTSTDAALGDYIAKGRPRANKPTQAPKQSGAYQEYLDAYNRAKGRPDIQKKITERARKNGVVK